MSFRPEARLLLACAATGPGSPDLSSIAALARSDLDWQWLVRTARLHAVVPLVHRRLVQAGVERSEVRAQATAVAFRNLRLTAELVGLAREFEAQGIPMLAWKGPALAMLAWGDVALREFGDLDLVVFPEDYERASAVLVARGYRPNAVHTDERLRSLMRSGWHGGFTQEAEGHRLELHWRFTSGSSASGLALANVWKRRQEIRVGNGSVLSPDTEDLFLLLAEHGARHAWERLGWIVDIARLASGAGQDWERVLARAQSLGYERMVLLSLSLAHRLLGAELPGPVVARFPIHPTVTALGDRVTQGLFGDTPGNVGVSERKSFWLRMRERRRDRLRLTAGMLFGVGEGDWAALQLPERLHPLYYVLRPFRLTWRFGAGLVGVLLRR